MTTISEIPLVAAPQTLTVTLNGVDYTLTLKWNKFSAAWVMDVALASGAILANGVPLLTGADLLGQLAYLAIGGQMVVQTDNDVDAVPTFSNLGSTGHLFYAL